VGGSRTHSRPTEVQLWATQIEPLRGRGDGLLACWFKHRRFVKESFDGFDGAEYGGFFGYG
jgi:hypothetical protein